MKKIFCIISASMATAVLAFIITLCFITTKVKIVDGLPYSIIVFNKSTTATTTNGYTKDNAEYDKILNKIANISKVSVFKRLVNKTAVSPKIEQDTEGKFIKWSTELKTKNVVIELIFDKEQDLIVYVGEDSRVISYFALAIVIPDESKFSEILMYYSATNNTTDSSKDESYQKCNPLMVRGNAKSLVSVLSKI